MTRAAAAARRDEQPHRVDLGNPEVTSRTTSSATPDARIQPNGAGDLWATPGGPASGANAAPRRLMGGFRIPPLEWRTKLYLALELTSGSFLLAAGMLSQVTGLAFGPPLIELSVIAAVWYALGIYTAVRRCLQDGEVLATLMSVTALLLVQGVLIDSTAWRWLCAATLAVVPIAAVTHLRGRTLVTLTLSATCSQVVTVFSLGGPVLLSAYTAATFATVTTVPVMVVAVLVRTLESARQQAERVARTDSLTGLLNRHGLRSAGLRVLHAAAAAQERICVLALDVDHFKKVNDTWGHSTGDRVLQAVAGALKSVVREQDVVVRHGGEEFLVVTSLLDTSAEIVFAERLRSVVAMLNAPGVPMVTVSVGIASAPAQDIVDAAAQVHALPAAAGTVQDVVARLTDAADEALYAAKRAGRDRVRHHSAAPG